MTSSESAIQGAGGVVYCDAGTDQSADGQPLIAVILDKHGNWGLPKGDLEPGETEAQAARREIAEEVGLDCEIGVLVARDHYTVGRKGNPRPKIVAYFLARSECHPLTPRTEEGISQARWLPADAAIEQLTFENTREVVRRALELLNRGS